MLGERVRKCKVWGPRRAHTIVELAVGLLTVDHVEAVAHSRPHAADSEIEPLLVLGTVHIWVHQQVILKPGMRGQSWAQGQPIDSQGQATAQWGRLLALDASDLGSIQSIP